MIPKSKLKDILMAGLQISIFLCGLFFVQVAFAGGPDTKGDEEFARLAKQGQPLYLHYCAHCHGNSGDGDGFNSDFLDKDPAELSDTQFIKKRSNKKLFKTIQQGGAAVKKSYLMPVFGKTLSEKEIWALVAYVRYLAEDFEHPVSLPEDVSDKRPRTREETLESIRDFKEWYKADNGSIKTVKRGQQLFKDKLACFACHQVEDEGGHVGPDLTRAGFLYNPEWLFMWMRNPQFARPNTKMPNLGLKEDDARAVSAFLSTLTGEDDPSEELQAFAQLNGNPEAGKKLFFDTEGKANCSKCHSIRGEGGVVGPDLGFVGTSRTKEFLIESIIDPSAVITVGYASVLVLTKEGKFLTGIKRYEDENSLDILSKDGKSLHIPKDKIKKFKTQKISIMPGNFKDILSQQEIADLLAYLAEQKVLNLLKSSAN